MSAAAIPQIDLRDWMTGVRVTGCERVIEPIECVACGRKVKPRDGEVTLCTCGALLTTDQD